MAKQAAYHLLLEISEELRPMSYKRKMIEEQFEYDALTRNDTGRKSIAIKNMEYTSINHLLLSELSTLTTFFVVKEIIPNIKMYNLLWHRPPSSKTQERRIIAELIRIKLLFRTETVGIYLVNPLKIWRGNPLVAVEATKYLLRENGKPCAELIHDLRPAERYDKTTQEKLEDITRDGFKPRLLS